VDAQIGRSPALKRFRTTLEQFARQTAACRRASDSMLHRGKLLRALPDKCLRNRQLWGRNRV